MVYQDTKGFVWVATDNGVVKYDGHDFITYNTTNGLTDNTVFGFYEDNKGRIWFRTYNGALSYYENDTIRPYKYNAQLKSIINASILVTIRYDSLDELYFSVTVDAFAGKIDSKGIASVLTPKQTEAGERFMAYVGDEALVVTSGLPRNVNAIRLRGKEFPIEVDDRVNQSNWLVASVKWKGRMYFTIHKNIFTYDGQAVRKVYTSDHSFISLYVDKQDRLWAGHFNHGVEVFSDESLADPFTLKTVAGLSVSGIMQDYEGGMWLSTLDQGVYYFPNLTIQNYDPPNNTRVSAITYSDDEIYIGNYSGEIYKINRNGIPALKAKVIAPVGALFIDSESKLWVVDGSGTHILETGKYVGGAGNLSKTFKSFSQAEGYLLGCSSMGVYKIALNGDMMDGFRIRKRPMSITKTSDAIYLGGLFGVEELPLDLSPGGTTILEARISTLHTVDNRFVMMGTAAKGLYAYDAVTQVVKAIPIADVVNVHSMLSDWSERRLWIGTDKGLFQLDFAKDTSALVLNTFSKADGLLASKINAVCRVGDNIWAISDLGISAVPLGHFRENQVAPKFYVNRILLKDRTISADLFGVQTEEEDMVIDVRPITFKNHPTFFRYRLKEDQSWKMISGGSIFLTDLRPDKYNVEIQASTGNTDWTKGHTLRIEVMAKWWTTMWFKIVVVLTVIALGYVAYWMRIGAIRRKQKYLELINLHQQKLIDSEIRTQERERKRIATDLHDGIGATLSSIKMQISDAMSDRKDEGPGRGKEINDNLTDVIDDIKRIVYDLHPPGLERYGLQSGLKSLVDRLNKISDIDVIFDYYGQREVEAPISITIFRILQELINNTLKHARASEIRIHINEFEDEINIMYEDNGIGMIGSRFTGLGLHSIESRVRSLNGRMTWESNHKGTFYNFDIPF